MTRIFLVLPTIAALYLPLDKMAFGQTCPDPDLQVIQQPPLLVAYTSWVSPPRNGGQMYSFGRCTGTLTEQPLTIDWQGTQLKGSTTKELPLIATFPYVDGTPHQAASVLQFEVDSAQRYQKAVNFLANAQEIGAKPTQSDVLGLVQNFRNDIKDGKKVDEAVLRAVNSARIPILDHFKAIALLKLTLTSFLTDQPIYRYLISFEFSGPDASTPPSLPKNLFLQSKTSSLAQAISTRFKDGGVPLNENKGSFGLQISAGGLASMEVGQLYLVSGTEVLSSVTVSIYVPVRQ
jgi:hypothetical protein